MIANNGAGRDIRQHDHPEPVDLPRALPAIELGNHDDKAAIQFVGVHLDAIKRVVYRALNASPDTIFFSSWGPSTIRAAFCGLALKMASAYLHNDMYSIDLTSS